MKLKQDVESSWECPFVSVSEGRSEAQHAFCNVESSLYNLYVMFNVLNNRSLRKVVDLVGCYKARRGKALPF